jgi:hypothetical protein
LIVGNKKEGKKIKKKYARLSIFEGGVGFLEEK